MYTSFASAHEECNNKSVYWKATECVILTSCIGFGVNKIEIKNT